MSSGSCCSGVGIQLGSRCPSRTPRDNTTDRYARELLGHPSEAQTPAKIAALLLNVEERSPGRRFSSDADL